MNKIIYIDENGKLKAYANVSLIEFNQFKEKLSQNSIIYFNDEVFEQNVPEEYKDIYKTFIKSCIKMWASSHTLSNPIK